MAAGAVEVNITSNNSFKGAKFDAVDDYVEIPHNANQLGANLSDGFTVSAWINHRLGEGGTGIILDKSTGATGLNGFQFYTTGNENVLFRINNGDQAFSPNGGVPFGVWTHCLYTISAAQIAAPYINGVLVIGTRDLTQAISTIVTTNAPKIGNRATATDRTFNGTIKGIKMWNKVLDSDERASTLAGLATAKDNLILDFPLQDDYNDISDTGLTGTNSGTHFAIVDDAIAAAIKADRTTANDTYLIAGFKKNGQIVSAVIEEAP